jgi:hypothetical protein
MVIGLVLAYPGQSTQEWRSACMQRCATAPMPMDPETQRQEIVNLEHETVRAIQLNNGTFFRRVYSDDFVGILSHGQSVDKTKFINLVQSASVKYDTFVATGIRIRLDRETAVATCVWSSRGNMEGKQFSGQMRILHVYVNGQSGWQLIASEATLLPPDSGAPL